MSATTARCFGQRMLSPFRGIMHCVATRWADAVTTDGRRWTLYVRGECLYDNPDELEDDAVSVPDVKYGTWSAQAGLQRAPIRLPTLDERVRQEGEALLAAVECHRNRLPFPLADQFELWLLHGETGLPLALIDSRCRREDCEPPVQTRWTAGQVCIAELPEAARLNAEIAGLAGDRPRAQWFERQPDASGRPCCPPAGAADATGAALPATCFAPLFVDRCALDAPQRRLLDLVEHWQSPFLLQLPSLTVEQRDRFEAAACRHALRLAEQLPLYPCTRDAAAITAALVEARLRRSNPARRHRQRPAGEGVLSPDYIEIPEH
jgi:hypothetical protein